MFFMNDRIDDGDIIGKYKINISKNESIKDILKKCDIGTLYLLKKYLHRILSNNIKRIEQNQNLATYRRLRNNNNSIINWNDKSINIYNKIRAISDPYPGAYFIFSLKKYKVLKSKVLSEKYYNSFKNSSPGSIINTLKKNKYTFKTGDGFITVKLKYEIKKN